MLFTLERAGVMLTTRVLRAIPARSSVNNIQRTMHTKMFRDRALMRGIREGKEKQDKAQKGDSKKRYGVREIRKP